MGFEAIDISSDNTKGHAGTGVSASLVRLKQAGALLRLTIRPNVLRMAGFGEDSALTPLIGRNEDFGLIRLVADDNGQARLVKRKMRGGGHYYQIGLGRRPEFVDRAEKPQPCQWEMIDDRTIEIVLPPWADETNPVRKKTVGFKSQSDRMAEKEALRLEAEHRQAEQRRRERARAEEIVEGRRIIRAALNDVGRLDPKLGLTQTEADILSVLIQRDGRPVYREQMMTLVYGHRVDDPPLPKTLDVHFTKIRKKIEARSCSIENVSGAFRFCGDKAALLIGGVS